MSRYPWAIAAGLILAAAFPKLGVAGLAWVAPGLMLLAAAGTRGWRCFRIGYAAGVAFYLGSLYWLLLIPVAWFPILGWAALSGFIALYPATWVWLCWKWFPAKDVTDNSKGFVFNLSERMLVTTWSQRFVWTLSGAALWVAWEMVMARFLGGFPWNLLGSSQWKIVPLIQVAAVTGIYGVAFLVVWGSLSLLCAGVVMLRRPERRSAWLGEVAAPMVVVMALYISGYFKLMRPEETGRTLDVALIQPSIPQTLIWDSEQDDFRFKQLLELSQKAVAEKPQLMIWPEAALPRMLRYDDDIGNAVARLARDNHLWMIVGSDDKEPNPKSPDKSDYYNASFLIGPGGTLVERYIKRDLVIFGEYIPLLDWLPFLKYFTPIEGGFVAGKHAVPFVMKDLGVNVSVLICFEDVFPQLARQYVSDDTDFLVNITNDGWFGQGAAQWQQAAGATFRAVENGVPLVRCSNNGLTCWIDEHGRVRQYFDNGDIYGPGYLSAHVPLLSRGEKWEATFYRLHGDVFGWSCVGWILARVAGMWISGRKQRNEAVVS